ncbi:hypothetical protein D1B31_00030 [Neobacillus notoginsengisoli]|uniref:Uncharacterized protein n=1 Tax=Neobacillus notoginsengisoli TaxID=1578198 RepID=A0A417YZ14_9BACI|nr:hypothetical protein [Neobacillus notoginsengisoli]RHW43105.1 hypothetical protein D1B31_00030 [Neobacillus notoginsengisoli]
MGVCSVCNGLRKFEINCDNCNELLEEKGRYMDYFDDYSPYMPIDQMKLEDGIPDDYKNRQCPHLYRCSSCGTDRVILISE